MHCRLVRWSRHREKAANPQCPEFPVLKMKKELRPSERVGDGVVPVDLNPLGDKSSLIMGQEAFLFSFIREVDNDEPRDDRNDNGHEAFDDLPPSDFG
jgi:hypothetical protein